MIRRLLSATSERGTDPVVVGFAESSYDFSFGRADSNTPHSVDLPLVPRERTGDEQHDQTGHNDG